MRRVGMVVAPLLLLAVLVGVSLTHPAPARGQPYVPKADSEVLETLPARTVNTGTRADNGATAPTDPVAAAAQARAELTLYQQSADPRYLGRAEAALGNFWEQTAPPEPILVLRARVRQSNHEFLSALTDLNRALSEQPNDGQALLDRASIETVIGRYDAASSDCQLLEPLTFALYTVVCRASISGVTGQARTAYSDLSRALSNPALDPEDRCWGESLLGELAARLGENAQAEAHFRSELSACPNDTYARGALADLLLDLDRAPEVVKLLAGQTKQDALLLRLVIAERHVHASAFDEHFKDLEQRFEEARLRGNQVHRREEARFELALRDAPDPALALARMNFQVQREPADVRIALEAAVAAKQPAAVRDVIAFVTRSRLEDPHIQALLAKLRQ